MNFYDYVINLYGNETSAKNDFAVDLKQDRDENKECFTSDIRIFRHLNLVDMCYDARNIYEILKEEYLDYKKKIKLQKY